MYEVTKNSEYHKITHRHTVFFTFADDQTFVADRSGAVYRPVSLSIVYSWVEGQRVVSWKTNGDAVLRAVRIKKDGTDGAVRVWDYGLPLTFRELVDQLGRQHRPADMPKSEMES